MDNIYQLGVISIGLVGLVILVALTMIAGMAVFIGLKRVGRYENPRKGE